MWCGDGENGVGQGHKLSSLQQAVRPSLCSEGSEIKGPKQWCVLGDVVEESVCSRSTEA